MTCPRFQKSAADPGQALGSWESERPSQALPEHRLRSVCIPCSEGDTHWVNEGTLSLLIQHTVTSGPGAVQGEPCRPRLSLRLIV